MSPSYEAIETTEDDVPPPRHSRLVVYALHCGDAIGATEASLEKVGNWEFDGPASTAGVYHEENGMLPHLRHELLCLTTVLGAMTFFFITWDGHFIRRKLDYTPQQSPLLPQSVPETPLSPDLLNLSAIHNLSALPLHNPFKAIKSPSTENLTPADSFKTATASRFHFGEEEDVGLLGSLPEHSLLGYDVKMFDGVLRGLAWSKVELLVNFFNLLLMTNLTLLFYLRCRPLNTEVEDSEPSLLCRKRRSCGLSG
jgi:WD repeat-containing protein 7